MPCSLRLSQRGVREFSCRQNPVEGTMAGCYFEFVVVTENFQRRGSTTTVIFIMSSVITIASVVEADITISAREILRFSVFIAIFSPIETVVIRLSRQMQQNDAQ